MALRLHICSHHAVAHHGLAVFAEEGRNDGVKRPLARRYLIGTCLQTEAMAPILQTDAKFWLYAARAKPHVIALNKAHHHAVFIGSTQVNSAALDRVACAKILGFFHINEFGTRRQVRVVEHLFGRHLH